MGWRDMISCCPTRNFGNMFQARPDEIHPECRHTIKSHGAELARNHKNEWLILILLIILEIVFYVIHPFKHFVGEDMMEDLKYPLKATTVRFWVVPLYAVLFPIVIFVLYYLRRKDVYDLHNSILGILLAAMITGVLTEATKDAVGRPRPDFFRRCFPDGQAQYNRWGNVVCHGKAGDIREGYKSFPSGHTSWSFAGLGFLSLYLAGKLKCFDRRGHVVKLCIVFLPLVAAFLVGVSLLNDYMHHWQDVFAGALLGLVVATLCYLQFYPPPYHMTQGWAPYAYFRAMEQTRANSQPVHPGNGIGMSGMNQQPFLMDRGVVDPSSDSTIEAMEHGRS